MIKFFKSNKEKIGRRERELTEKMIQRQNGRLIYNSETQGET